MKKFINLLAISAVILIASSQLVFAATKDTPPHPTKVLPDTVDIYYELNTGADNPLEEMIFIGLETELTLFQASEEAMSDLMEILGNNVITLAMDMTPGMDLYTEEPNLYASFYIYEEDFNRILEQATEEPEIIVHENKNIYKSAEDSFFVFMNGLVTTTNTLENAEEIIEYYNDVKKTPTLQNLEEYQNTAKYFSDSAFLNLYVNPSFIVEQEFDEYNTYTGGLPVDPMSIDPDLMEALVAEGISLSQNAEGFSFIVYVEGDIIKLQNLDMMFDKFNFQPDLYKYLDGNDIIFFTEQYNLTDSVQDSLKLLESETELLQMYEDFQDWFSELTLMDFKYEVLPLFDSNYAVAVHNNDQLMPAVTAMMYINHHTTDLVSSLASLSNTLKETWEGIEEETGTEFYTYEIVSAGGASFYQHRLKLPYLFGEELTKDFSDEELVLSYTLQGRRFIVSTHSDIDKIYSVNGGMLSNETFAANYTDRDSEISGIAYFDAVVLENYLEYGMEILGASEDDINFMKGILAPWHSFYTEGFAHENMSWAFGSLNVDIEGFATYDELLAEFFQNLNAQYEIEELYPEELPLYEGMDYCDVSPDDWYYLYVDDLTYIGIISGYEDGCFKPNEAITRAEYTKMVLGAAEWSGLYLPVAMSDQDIYFDDVPADQWYWHFVNQAAANGYVNGYEDGTFKPNEPISRSEAVQILYNISTMLQSSSGFEPFDDVSEEDWFFEAICAAYFEGLVQGISETQFDPNRNITRAEASKIVDEFLYLY